MPQSKLAVITFLDGQGGYPDQGLPGYGGYPDNSLPSGSGGRPDNSLPPGATTLPVFPFDPTLPDQGLPGGGGSGGHPSTGPIVPGKKFIVKWLACKGLILVPDNSLPGGAPETPDNELPDTPSPKSRY